MRLAALTINGSVDASLRRTGPFAASLALNVAFLFAVLNLYSLGTEGRTRFRIDAPMVAVTLVPDLPTTASSEATSAASPTAGRGSLRQQPSTLKHRADAGSAEGALPETVPSGGEAAVDLGSSASVPSDAPAGLAGLLNPDPCKKAIKPSRDCNRTWNRLRSQDPQQEALAGALLDRKYPGLVTPDSCGSRHLGCLKSDWRSSIGTRAVGTQSAMAGGAGHVGGLAVDLIGRLPPHNEYQRDPGFGD